MPSLLLAPRYKEDLALCIQTTHSPINGILEDEVEDILAVLVGQIHMTSRQAGVVAPVIREVLQMLRGKMELLQAPPLEV